jgi:hypothetical protein
MTDRREQLQLLASNLAMLCELLSLDPRCQWRKHFASCLAQANSLLAREFSQEELTDLSASVNGVFRGMGSFNDYAPATKGPDGQFTSIPGMEKLEELSSQVYDSALALRVVGYVI